MNKHTPGPWEIGHATWDENGDATYTLVGIKKVSAPDARLIAAAPDLLEALETISVKFGHIDPQYRDDAENQVMDAIAKAKGECRP